MRKLLLCAVLAFAFVVSGTAYAGAPPPKPANKDINAATAKDLMTVPGIGKKSAARILEYREKKGTFTSMYQLQEVKGIGKATLDKLICAFHAADEGVIPCPTGAVGAGSGGQVNLNTSTPKELTKIPGIGMKKAYKIVEYRDKNGPYRSAYEIQKVKGFGKKTVEKFLTQVTVKVNINTATAAQLKVLGFANADAIVAQRKKAGGFKDAAELGTVEGADAAQLKKVSDVLVTK
jgi:competence protein ComEA